MAKRRKPISFDTTLRNPERIPQFVSILSNFEGEILNDEIALKLEAEIIRQKIFVPTRETLGKYRKEYNEKFSFSADDQSMEAEAKVERYYQEWDMSDPGVVPIDKIVYLLKNTITAHKEKGWKGGWESRIHTQFNFINELGFAYVEKNKVIKISENGKLLISSYSNGVSVLNGEDSSSRAGYLTAFAKYQTNNPFRKNTIEVNFLSLTLNTMRELNSKYKRKGLSKQDLAFLIVWEDNNYKLLAKTIDEFRRLHGYNTSDELVYEYVMNYLDDSASREILTKGSEKFIESKQKDYKFSKILKETPDEMIRKMRNTGLISLRGGGRFIDINNNELQKINHILSRYAENIDYKDDKDSYFRFMGQVDTELDFIESEYNPSVEREQLDVKEKLIKKYSESMGWEDIKRELLIVSKKRESKDEVMKYITGPVRLEFLIAIAIKKALPNVVVKANYTADDEGLPFGTAPGSSNNRVGADIEIFQDTAHVLIEPTLDCSRQYQVEHEVTSIRNHVLEAAKLDAKLNNPFNQWFAVFIAPIIRSDVGDQVALIKNLNEVEIFPWEIEDFITYLPSSKSILELKQIREYAKHQVLTEVVDRISKEKI